MTSVARAQLIGIDLMPKPLKLSLLRKNRIRAWCVVIMFAALLASVPMGYELVNQHRLAKATSANQQRAQLLRDARQTLLAIQDDAQSHADQLAFSNALRAKRNWSDVLTLVANATGDDVWLVSIQSAAKPQTAAAMTPVPAPNAAAPSNEIVLEGPRSLILEGYARDHARLYTLMAYLRDHGRFLDVDLSRAGVQKIENSTSVHFRLECQW